MNSYVVECEGGGGMSRYEKIFMKMNKLWKEVNKSFTFYVCFSFNKDLLKIVTIIPGD